MKVPCSSAARPGPRRRRAAARGRTAGRDPGQRLVDVRPDRLGVDPPKYGLRSLWISVIRIRPSRSRRGIQPEPTPYSGSTRREVGGLQLVEVDRPADELLVALEQVEALDQPGRLGVGQRPALDRRAAVLRDRRLEDRQDVAARGRPLGALTLKPLSVHGLCDAVITIPAAAPRSTTSYELIWVGTPWVARKTGMSWASRTSDAAAAKCSEANRRSNATTTPGLGRPCRRRSAATPSAQRRTFSNV